MNDTLKKKRSRARIGTNKYGVTAQVEAGPSKVPRRAASRHWKEYDENKKPMTVEVGTMNVQRAITGRGEGCASNNVIEIGERALLLWTTSFGIASSGQPGDLALDCDHGYGNGGRWLDVVQIVATKPDGIVLVGEYLCNNHYPT